MPELPEVETICQGLRDKILNHNITEVHHLTKLKLRQEIPADIAQKIIGDHYDVYLNKENPCSRTCCSHYELDGREYMSDPSRPKPFQPRGALDGNVVDSNMAKNMSFSLKWGSSCGIPFDKNKFCNENRVWDYLRPYLYDRPQQKWTTFSTFTKITGTTKNKTSRKYNRKSRTLKIKNK